MAFHRFILIAVLAALPCLAQPKKTVFMITDAEGVAGICRQDQTEPKDPELRALLTGEINAAVDGFLAGGADEVIVWDGHDGSQTLSTTTIHPRARLIIGNLGPTMSFERGYTALAFVGQHSRANVRGGIMAHSYSSLGIQNMLVNGKPVGEIAVNAAIAGHFGIPTIFLSGDKAAVQEMLDLQPDVVTAEVKEGFSRYACISLSAQMARDLTRKQATEAARKMGSIKPYKISGPVTLQIEYTTRNSLAIGADLGLGREQMDDRTIRIQGKDILEAWTRYRTR